MEAMEVELGHKQDGEEAGDAEGTKGSAGVGCGGCRGSAAPTRECPEVPRSARCDCGSVGVVCCQPCLGTPAQFSGLLSG